MSMKARVPTAREKQIAGIASAFGVSYQSVMHAIRSLTEAGDPYAVKFKSGTRGSRLSIEQVVSVTLALTLDRPAMASELVPLLATAVPIQTEAAGPAHSMATQPTDEAAAEMQKRIDALESQVEAGFRAFASSWRLPGITLMDGLAGIIRGLTGEHKERYLDYYSTLRLEVTIFCQPFIMAEVTAWYGEASTVRTKYAPRGIPPNLGGGISNPRRQTSIPLAYFEAIANMLLADSASASPVPRLMKEPA